MERGSRIGQRDAATEARNMHPHLAFSGRMNSSSCKTPREVAMTRLAYAVVLIALAATTANAQTPPSRDAGPSAQTLSSIPPNSVTITHWYKQNVYDPGDNKIGEIMDVLVDREGKATALIIGVGGFLGIGEKDVAVPFNAVRVTTKDNNKWYLVMNTTKDALKGAKGFKYDRTAMTWIPEDAPATTGQPGTPAPKPGNR